MNKADINTIFKVAADKQNVVCPPAQVFTRPEFDLLFTIGGDLVADGKEYDRLISFLKANGETEFYIRENIGATVTKRNEPFQKTINLNDDYETFQLRVRAFEPPFGWAINHFYIYGQSGNWGIYICEYPTINIIGCDKSLSDELRQVFSIDGNGYASLKEFIEQEFHSNPDQLKEFKKQYNLED